MVRDELDRLGIADVTFTTRGSEHRCATFLCPDGRTRKVFYSSTKTDYRDQRDMIAQVRRAARGVG
jgi:hypothetical protein